MRRSLRSGLLAFVALGVAACTWPEGHSLPFCDGNVLHEQDERGVEVTRACAACRSGQDYAECVAVPLGSCLRDTCALDGAALAECGVSGYWVDPAAACPGETWCHDDGHLAECRECGPYDCGGPCGECACGHTCETGFCVYTACDDRECGGDGCGGFCFCSERQICDIDRCECAPDTCGPGCVACGAREACVDGRCECAPGNCGPLCLPCGDGQECVNGSCACRPDTCGPDCGFCGYGQACVEDSCACAPDTCGVACARCDAAWGSCDDGRCACAPSCDGRVCGPDGCGDACGWCAPGLACVEGECVIFAFADLQAWHVDALAFADPGWVAPGDPCWVDDDGDGQLDLRWHAWEPVDFGMGMLQDLLLSGIDAGIFHRLLLVPSQGEATADAWWVWARRASDGQGYVILQSTAYDRPVPPARLPLEVHTETSLEAGPADLWLFDAASLAEGSTASGVNAALLELTYVPLRDARVKVARSTGTGTATLDGTLTWSFARDDLERAVWPALAHCGQSGHGAGTCQALEGGGSGWLTELFWWVYFPELADAETLPACARMTASPVEVRGIQGR